MLMAAFLGLIPLAPCARSATMTFGNAQTISGDTDAFNVGAFSYGYSWSSTGSQTVNGVTFTKTSITSGTTSGGNLGITGTNTLVSAGTAMATSSAPFANLSAAYQNLLDGVTYIGPAGASTITVSLNNLASGHVYATQVWEDDSRGGTFVTRNATINGGGNTITLKYDVAQTLGGLGQYTIGGFTANATAQTFVLSSSNNQIQLVQLRDVTGVWSGAASANWNSSDVNWTSGEAFSTVTGLVNTEYFADTDGFANAVTNKNIAVAAGGISSGSLVFQNTVAGGAYSFSGGALAVTGTIAQTGSGQVTLANAVTASGTTTLSAGTLIVSGSLSGTTSIAVGTATLSAILSGNGTIKPSGSISVAAAGFLAPGTGNTAAGIGTLTLDHSGDGSSTALLSLASGAPFTFKLENGSNDELAIINGVGGGKDIVFNNDTLNVADLTGGSLVPGQYTLFTDSAAGGYAGLTLDGSNNITAGLSLATSFTSLYPGSQLQEVGHNIVLAVVPEPGAAVFVLSGLGVLCGFRRRRRFARAAKRHHP